MVSMQPPWSTEISIDHPAGLHVADHLPGNDMRRTGTGLQDGTDQHIRARLTSRATASSIRVQSGDVITQGAHRRQTIPV